MGNEEGKPVLIDLFCGAGGCTKGYQRAGFYVIGVDLSPQPNYCGDEFFQADALAFDLTRADAVHASPLCQAHSPLGQQMSRQYDHIEHVDLIPPTRELVQASGLPYVIENVPGAPLIHPTVLCGSSFGLGVRRHRLFETNWPLMGPTCAHGQQAPQFEVFEHGHWRLSPTVPVYGSGGGKAVEHWPWAMGIDWMTRAEMSQAIPPAFTELIGHQLMAHVRVPAV